MYILHLEIAVLNSLNTLLCSFIVNRYTGSPICTFCSLLTHSVKVTGRYFLTSLPTGPYPNCPAPYSLNHLPITKGATLKRSCEFSKYPVMALYSNLFSLHMSSHFRFVEVWSKQGWRLAVMGLSCRPLPRGDLGSQTMVTKQLMSSAVCLGLHLFKMLNLTTPNIHRLP